MLQTNNKYHVFILATLMAVCSHAQKDAHAIYDGNNMYYSGKEHGAQAKYAKALELNPNNRKANFNLGNALYRNAAKIKSGQLQIPAGSNITPDSLSKMVFDQAAQNYAIVANSISNKDTLHRAWHNIGNCYLKQKDYQQAVDAYKKALKLDSKDEDTRYNLAYALKNLPKEKKKGGGGGQQQQKQEEKNKEKKEQQQNKMSREQAEQLLKAMMESEKKLQDKRKQKAQDPSQQVDKDW